MFEFRFLAATQAAARRPGGLTARRRVISSSPPLLLTCGAGVAALFFSQTVSPEAQPAERLARGAW